MAKILIVEDDSELQIIYQRKLSHEGHEIFTATTGEEGLTLAQSKKPDIILLDVMLPGGLNGFDVLEQLKRTPAMANTPILILTNLDTEQNTAMSIGANDYIIKANTSLDQMVEKVNKYLQPSSGNESH
jgi:DNA-binding response OmpR family regulator